MNKKLNALTFMFLFFIAAGCGKKEAPVPEAVDTFFFKVQFVVGDVKISGAAGEKAAVQGDQVKVSEKIITGKKSVADLAFGATGVVRVNENSAVTITAIADKTNNDTVLDMENGKLFLTLKKLKGTGLKVKTSTVVASVRGTSFTVVSDKKGSKLSVVKGSVALNPVKDGNVVESKTVMVETGNRTDYIDKKAVERIIIGEMAIPVMEMTPADKIEIQAEIKEIKFEAMPDLTLEIRNEIKQETVPDAVIEPKKEDNSKKEEKAAEMKRLAEEKKKKEEDSQNLALEAKNKEDEMKRKEEEMKRQAEEKKKKEEQLKKDRASNIPTM